MGATSRSLRDRGFWTAFMCTLGLFVLVAMAQVLTVFTTRQEVEAAVFNAQQQQHDLHMRQLQQLHPRMAVPGACSHPSAGLPLAGGILLMPALTAGDDEGGCLPAAAPVADCRLLANAISSSSGSGGSSYPPMAPGGQACVVRGMGVEYVTSMTGPGGGGSSTGSSSSSGVLTNSSSSSSSSSLSATSGVGGAQGVGGQRDADDDIAAAPYQRRNLYNALHALAATRAGHWWWNDWSVWDGGFRAVVGDVSFEGSVLDLGADPSGQQLRLLKRHVRGAAVGFNIAPPFGAASFDPQASVPGASMVYGPAEKALPFARGTFDAVLSMNVLEHVSDLGQYLGEAARVLKSGGLLYLDWYPVWTSARGHHVHDGMVQRWAGVLGCKQEDVQYRNDGSVIPDWSHLLVSSLPEFESLLQSGPLGACPGLSAKVAQYVLESDDLNRKLYFDVVDAIQNITDLVPVKAVTLQVDGQAVLTDEVKQQLHAKFPKETHFALGETILLLQKRAETAAAA